MTTRCYPHLPPGDKATLPLSFVCVKFSNDYMHNLATSDCVHDPLNELVVVDNQGNIFFDTLSKALCAGISRAHNALLVLVHEDVVLPAGWQAAFERALTALEQVDPHWGVIGVAGCTASGAMCGHWSDPHGYSDKLQGRLFAEVVRIDEQLIVLRRDGDVHLDAELPSIHNIGRDLACAARRAGRRTYVVNAPTIHKYADAQGRLIQTVADSAKIQARSTRTYLADKALSDEYLRQKWQDAKPTASPNDSSQGLPPVPHCPPVVLVCRGGGGSRLLSVLAQEAGIFLGNELGSAGDSMEMVSAVYKGVLSKFRYPGARAASRTVEEIRAAALAMLVDAGQPAQWGFKLPESILLLEEISTAFPGARFVHMVRDPLGTCLRRTHMTARLDNQIGQATLCAAYRYVGRDPACILDDSPAIRMAITTVHQLENMLRFSRSLPRRRFLQLRFEDMIERPKSLYREAKSWLYESTIFSRWRSRVLGARETPLRLIGEIDKGRAVNPSVRYEQDIVAEVEALVAYLRNRLGYR